MLVEGPHLLAAALASGAMPVALLATEAALAKGEIDSLVRRARLVPVLLSDGVFQTVADAEAPPGIAAEIAFPHIEPVLASQSVFLEGIQDPSNVGAIIRSAAAFGVGDLVLDRSCADPWSPKALRAGMGGHFALRIREAADLLGGFRGRLVCTVARGGTDVREADLSGPLGWVFGSEGGGVSPAVQDLAALRVTIPTAPATESLNVGAAAAICLYEAFSRRKIGL